MTLAKTYEQLYKEKKSLWASLERIPLLKSIEATSIEIFQEHINTVLAPQDKERQLELYKSCFKSKNLQKEFSQEFYRDLNITSEFQELIRVLVRLTLEDPEKKSGWNDFDRTLIIYSTKISSLYDPFYISWAQAVQGNSVSTKLKEPEVASKIDKVFLNGYTIIQLDDQGNFYHEPYSKYFSSLITPIAKTMEEMIHSLENLTQSGSTEDQKFYISYLKQYHTCLTATENMEEKWEELDRKWMDVKHEIQIVHDIESGYGDPLRVKIIPDFSLRFVDESYAKENETMSKIQDQMVVYYKTRETDLSRRGIRSLSNCMSAIYYIPFQSSMSLHFRFSGQSIPNRVSVKEEKGVKLFFDPTATANRLESTKDLIKKVFSDQSSELCETLDPADTIVYHVSSHEIGHSIYHLKALEDLLLPTTPALLEEPRAELTSLFTMNLMYDNKFLNLEQVQNHFISFMIQDLRRFASYDSSATRPYTISATHTYNLYLKTGFITWNREEGKLSLDRSKALETLQRLSELFLTLLKAEDDKDAPKIEQILKDMQHESDLILWLVSKLKK